MHTRPHPTSSAVDGSGTAVCGGVDVDPSTAFNRVIAALGLDSSRRWIPPLVPGCSPGSPGSRAAARAPTSSLTRAEIALSRGSREPRESTHMRTSPLPQRFPTGRIVLSRGALYAIPSDLIGEAIRRHVSGDWGDISRDSAHANELAVATEGKISSAYRYGAHPRFWIVTEADRSATMVVMPDERVERQIGIAWPLE